MGLLRWWSDACHPLLFGQYGYLSYPQRMMYRQISSFHSSSHHFDAVYVMNLDRRPDRWKFITQQLQQAGFNEKEYVRFPSIDGQGINIHKAHACGLVSLLGLLRLQENEARRIWGMDLNAGAIGCALSHAMLWAIIAAQRHRCVLVVEDDSLFPPAFHRQYEVRMRHVPSDWELVYVSGLDTNGQAPSLCVAEGVSRVPQLHRTTNCYVISHCGARRLLRQCLPMTYQLDTMMALGTRPDAQTRIPYVVQPVCYTLQPPLVVQATRMGSDIQSSNRRDECEEEKARCRAAGWDVDDNGFALKQMLQKLFSRKSPEERVKEWRRELNSEMRKVDAQVRKIQREEMKVKVSAKQAARSGDNVAVRMLAKEIIRSRRAVRRLYTARTQMNSVSMHLMQQVSQIKLAGNLKSSTEVMAQMNGLMQIQEVRDVMMTMSKEMMRAGLIDEVMNDTIDNALDEGVSDTELDEEVNKMVDEVMHGKMQGTTVSRTKLPQVHQETAGYETENDAALNDNNIEDEEEAELLERFNALRNSSS